MAKYRKKPVVIDAVHWNGDLSTLHSLGNYENVVSQDLGSSDLQIETLEGVMTAKAGD